MNALTDTVRYTRDKGFVFLTLNRPEIGNALSLELVEALFAHYEAISKDESIHTVVLQGSGKHFCTGFDLSNLDDENDASLLYRVVLIELLLDALWRLPRRTVCVAHGTTTGAGADLLVACDHRFLTPEAILSFPGAGFGLVLGTRRLAHRIGTDRALGVVGEGRRINSEESLALGLASAIVQDVSAVHQQLAAMRIAPRTYGQLRKAVQDEAFSDASLAALVRSASVKGIKERILAYRAARKDGSSPH